MQLTHLLINFRYGQLINPSSNLKAYAILVYIVNLFHA